ncbi:MAG: T9SS C-terminal target domain-containing protein [Bacteroidetes bacterium]|nr:MAG: T9SS C-terminal target domain-containing protein [Bacteroidota bacterium]
MKQLHYVLLLLFAAFSLNLGAQTRYVDEIFTDVDVTYGEIYGANISVLTGAPMASDLTMDVYTPAGDTQAERPVVIYFHTGTFLPQYINGQITGGKLDSTAVEICTRLAKRGYTAISATYRAGWNPLSPDANVRTETLLKAAYRGVIDARTCVRYLRMTADQMGNPYGVDTNRIVLWGQGTGGYISLGAATLDSYEEISALDKFQNTETFLPYVTLELDGNPFGTAQTPLNFPNHVGYSSEVHLAVNMGGAIGDTSWIDGPTDEWAEPPIIGYHVVTDPFAPIGNGSVREPVNNEVVIRVSGTKEAVEEANERGSNDVLTPVLQYDDPLFQTIEARVDAYQNLTLDLSALDQGVNTIATEHMYPFIPPINPETGGPRLESGPWDWWSKAQLDLVIAGVNAQLGTNFSSDQLHMDGLLTNPDMSAEKARAHIDTIMAHYLPRACQALNLEECAIVATEELADASLVNMQISPNPARDVAFIRTESDYPMQTVQLFDMNGMFLRAYHQVNSNTFRLDRQDLPAGMYLLKAKFKDGIVVRRVLFQ